ncbi:uncharacterized protein LY79DRAFT_557893 [Colletotrichum navitas]|uniref:Uncharacterized protein n=1 Tax=Colletotrichum navitas TaxID=681940 RepID=A0AAD8PW63_9PEZI|nr:uncharacterized protein LY79DRAFT_557893 [Colletotrichum navitas]KAK1585829.1 hypothetical protein LY79DRAFT_557893 [Colletotrichum navitas]
MVLWPSHRIFISVSLCPSAAAPDTRLHGSSQFVLSHSYDNNAPGGFVLCLYCTSKTFDLQRTPHVVFGTIMFQYDSATLNHAGNSPIVNRIIIL